MFLLRVILFPLLTLVALSAFGAPFTPGNVVIYRVGTGTGSLVNTGNPVFLDEFTPAGVLVQSIPLPTAVSGLHKRCVASGTSTSEGFLQRSTDGQFLVGTGYDSALPAGGTISSTTAARVIARINTAAFIDTTTALTDAATGNNPRSACSVDGTAFWFGGGASGIRYAVLGASTSADLTSTTLANVRQPGIFGGQLYGSSQSGTETVKGVNIIGTSIPISGTPTVTRLPGLVDANAAAVNMFFMADLSSSVSGLDTLYMADEGGTSGGLTKFSLVAGSWTANGKVGIGSDNYRGLTGGVLGSTVTLYATRAGGGTASGGGQLVSIVDTTGYNAAITATPTVLSTAAANTAYRGVAFAPRAILPDFTVSVSAPANASTGTNFNYTLTVSNIGTTGASAVAARLTLPPGLSFVSGAGASGFSAAHGAGIVNFTGGTLAVGQQVTLTVTVTTATAATYTMAVGAAVVDPALAISETYETNNSSVTAPSTIVTQPNTPPSFTQQPAEVSIGNGATTTLSALAAGSPTPTYQWYQGARSVITTPISGATSASFTTPTLFLNTSYWVRATNSQGAADSLAALVTVALSANADLSALSLSSFSFTPAFSAGTTSYTAYVADTVSSVTLSPTTASSYATLTVNGTPVLSGGTSIILPLNEGSNTITILLTAQDGSGTKSYTLNVMRSAPTLPAGSIAFIGFNADGDDDLAFVALTEIPENTVIHFSDNEWNGLTIGSGGAFVDFAESEWVWLPPAGGLSAGSVVVVNALSLSTTVSQGTLVTTDGGTRGLSNTAETVHAFMGSTRSPSGFLAAVSSDPALNITGTTLTLGTTCVKLADSSDGGIYNGARSGQTGYANYLPLIGNVNTQWTDVLDGTGASLLPFSTASFSLIGSPIYTHTNRDVLNPNRDVWSSGGVTMNGLQFINLGLQGIGRVSASLLDPATGETIGSVSDMQVSAFTKNVDGTFSGTFHFLPDGGPNSATNPNFAARINAFSFTFAPYTSTASTTAQNQLAMSFTGSTRFAYDHDGNAGTPAIFTTGLTPSSAAMIFGSASPIYTPGTTQSDGTFASRLCITGEGLTLDNRSGKTGTGWLSDEYAPGIYHFNASKQIDGKLTVPQSLIPHAPVGTTDFSTLTPVNGRRENQGFEGLSQSPDGTRLFAMMQSATLQDSASGNEGRFNTRVLVYDISSSDTPTAPIAQYVMQLPRIDDTAATTNGSTVTRNGSQSALLALSNSAFLILSRDGNGRGTVGAPPVFKSILMADLSSATNLASSYDAEGSAVAPNGILQAGVTPVSWTQALNILGGLGSFSTEVAKFGLNINGGDGSTNTLSDKWESTSLVSCADAANPNDFFLFLGNDNNFATTAGRVLSTSGSIQNYNAGLIHDTMILAYRVRIVAPGISVSEGSNTLNDAQTTAIDFGTSSPAIPVTRSFSIRNTGTGNLTGLSLSIDGPDAAAFSVTSTATAPLTSNTITSFAVRLLSSSAGTKTAMLRLSSNAPGALATFDIPITGSIATPISSWRQTNFGSMANSGLTADAADFDGDGISNLMEYALGSLPTNSLSNQGLAALPSGSITESAAILTDRLTLTFQIPDPAPGDITYTVQTTVDLSLWTDLATKTGSDVWVWQVGGTARILSSSSAGRSTIQIADPQPTTDPRRMMRLKVTSP